MKVDSGSGNASIISFNSKFKNIFRDSSFWSLLLINVFVIAYYLINNTGFKTIIWIYWCQSVIIGFFNFLNLLTVHHIKPGSITINDEPVTKDATARGCLAPFFAFHYGVFHLVYMVFIYAMLTDAHEKLDMTFLEISVAGFFFDQVRNFIRAKKWEQTHMVDAGTIFFIPYLRIVPMHLTILLPKFIGVIGAFPLFLVLKTIADLITHSITMSVYGKDEDDGDIFGNTNSI